MDNIKYIKELYNILLYDKLRITFVSQGEKFIIIETQETENTKKSKDLQEFYIEIILVEFYLKGF